jgi:hypothetical protein
MSAIIQFDIIRPPDGISPIVDYRSVYIRGWINFFMVDHFLSSEKEMSTLFSGYEYDTMTLEIWEDTDDYTTWLDWEILDPDFDPESTSDIRNHKISKVLRH